MIKRIFSVILLTSALFLTSFASAKPASCQVELTGYAPYKGTCEFKPGQNGSFDLLNVKESAHLFKDVMMVGVDVLSPGVGEAVVIYYAGPKAHKNNMVTTPIKRMNEDKACWVGEGVKICAR
jgi:hypothetical protein